MMLLVSQIPSVTLLARTVFFFLILATTLTSASSAPPRYDITNATDTNSLIHQDHSVCPLGTTPVSLPEPGLLIDPVRTTCCPGNANDRAVQTTEGIYCCVAKSRDLGSGTCTVPAVNVLQCPSSGLVIVINTLVCEGHMRKEVTEFIGIGDGSSDDNLTGRSKDTSEEIYETTESPTPSDIDPHRYIRRNVHPINILVPESSAECPQGSSAVGLPESGLLVEHSNSVCCPSNANNGRLVKIKDGIFCCLNDNLNRCSVPAIPALSCRDGAPTVQVSGVLGCSDLVKKNAESRNDLVESAASLSSIEPEGTKLAERDDISRVKCEAFSTAVPALKKGTGELYFVCCPLISAVSVDLNPKNPFAICHNGKPGDYGLVAKSAEKCGKGMEMTDMFGRGVWACHKLPDSAKRDDHDSRDGQETQDGQQHHDLSGSPIADDDGHTNPAAICDSSSVPVKASVTGAKPLDSHHEYTVCCGTSFKGGSIIDNSAGTVDCCIGEVCTYQPIDALACPDSKNETFKHGRDTEIVVCLEHQHQSLLQTSLVIDKRQTNFIAQCGMGLEVVRTQRNVSGNNFNYTACCPSYWTWLVVDEVNGKFLCCQGLECVSEVHGVEWCVHSQDVYTFMGVEICREGPDVQGLSHNEDYKKVSNEIAPIKRGPQTELDPSKLSSNIIDQPQITTWPCPGAYGVWTEVREADGTLHWWQVCCPDIVMIAMIDLQAHKVQCCVSGNCDHEPSNALTCEADWSSVILHRDGKSEINVCKEILPHNQASPGLTRAGKKSAEVSQELEVQRGHSPCTDAFPAWALVREDDGKMHRWLICCPQAAMDAVIDLESQRLGCCTDGNCGYEVRNAQDCDDGWYSLMVARKGKPRATVCKERHGNKRDLLGLPQIEAKSLSETSEQRLEVRKDRCLKGFVPVETKALNNYESLWTWTVCCPEGGAEFAVIDLKKKIAKCCANYECTIKMGNVQSCPKGWFWATGIKDGKDKIVVCLGDPVEKRQSMVEDNSAAQENTNSRDLVHISPQKSEERDEDVKICPKGSNVVEAATSKDNEDYMWTVCCPTQATDHAIVSIDEKTVTCCFGPMCAWAAVSIQRCPGGNDNQMAVGNDLTRTMVCRKNQSGTEVLGKLGVDSEEESNPTTNGEGQDEVGNDLEKRRGSGDYCCKSSGHHTHATPSLALLSFWTTLILALVYLITPSTAAALPNTESGVNSNTSIQLTCPQTTRGLAAMNLAAGTPQGTYLVCCPASFSDPSAMALIISGADHVICCSANEPTCSGKAESPVVCEGEGWKRVDLFKDGVEVCLSEGA